MVWWPRILRGPRSARLVVMPLTPGPRIGAYEVVSLLGEGGMGQVYRARDTTLNRDVALKILPPLVAGDPDRLARFRREAQLLAALNDPHIAQVYGFEETASTSSGPGMHALVMELVDGATLAARIAAGPLPVAEALAIARQIAAALDAAHEQGIVHRDLKPSNVSVREDGTVKVLDFGLAKALTPAGEPAVDAANSPTFTAHATELGLILGTAAYMAPEQARGRPVDKRADLWAFGVVVFEMLTGRQLFQGETVSDTLAAVLRQEIEWTALPANTPAGVRRLLRRCLERDRRLRLRDIGDAAVDLDASGDPPATSPSSTQASPRARRVAYAVAAGALIVAAAAIGVAISSWRGRAALASGPALRLSILPSPDRPLSDGGNPSREIALSPDGTGLVYVASTSDPSQPVSRHTQLEVRALGSREVRDIPGITDAHQPFFSPDGQWVGFFTRDNRLEKVSLAGGSPITLATRINGSIWSFGVWLRDGTIVFSSAGGLRRVSAEGGDVSTLVSVASDSARTGPELINSPTVAPSGRAILFSIRNGFDRGVSRIDAVRLDSGARSSVLDNADAPLLTPDGRHLLFERSGALLAAPFDDARLEVTGPAVPLIDDIKQSGPPEWTISETGTLAYVAAIQETDAIGLVTRDGTFHPLAIPRGRYSDPLVSPDGRTLAFADETPQRSGIRLFDFERGSLTTLQSAGAESPLAWTPDGQALAVTSETPNATGIALVNLAGGSRLLVPGGGSLLRDGSFSADGTRLAYTRQTGSPLDIWMLTLDHPPPVPLLDSPAAEHSPRFSPDGRWLAYVSDESGRPQVYVRRYPHGPPVVVSIDGGRGPVWRPDGREIFFDGVSNGRPALMAVALTYEGDAPPRLSSPVSLFDLQSADATGLVHRYETSGDIGGYDIMPDGSRFVMLRRDASPEEIVVVPHWMDGLASTGGR